MSLANIFIDLLLQYPSEDNQSLVPRRESLQRGHTKTGARQRWVDLHLRQHPLPPRDRYQYVRKFYLLQNSQLNMPNSLKWKPPSENSIDFKLVLRFPPSRYSPKEPDWHAKPLFLLYVWCGGNKYEEYDVMCVEDNEWEE
jgi:hypothetical protein